MFKKIFLILLVILYTLSITKKELDIVDDFTGEVEFKVGN
jgi:hypothetical protein